MVRTPRPDPDDIESGAPTPTAPAAPPPDPAPDPFDPAKLRLSQSISGSSGVKKILSTIPVRKPDKSWFVRVHQDPAFHLQTMAIEIKDSRELYLVDKSLWDELEKEPVFRPKYLALAINRAGILFIWESNFPLPHLEGRMDEWARSSLEAIEHAKTNWVRVVANVALGAYEASIAQGKIENPVWPELEFSMVLRLAFRNRFISDLDHPILRRLRGES